MLETSVSQEFIGRIDESMRPLIAKMVTDATFVAPALTSFTIGDKVEDETRTWTYSANT